MKKLLSILKEKYQKNIVILAIISGLSLALSWAGWLKDDIPFDIAWVSVVIAGTPLVYNAFKQFILKFNIKAGLLISIALIAAIAIGELFAAGEVAFIMMLGEMLEDRTVNKSREGIKKLIQIAPQSARIRTKDGDIEIPVDQVKVDDILLVKPGETIPVDGIITSGESSFNQAIITGESMPIDKKPGEDVYVGTINQHGAIEMRATKVGDDTSLAKLIRLIKESQEKKAPIVRVADKWATIIVPVALIVAILTYALTKDITRAVTILVVFCPCALVLATPTAIVAGVGNASKKGILVKSGEALEYAAKIDTIAFDKTGTITYGKPQVIDIVSVDGSSTEEILKISATAEKFSEHPIGKTIYESAQKIIGQIPDPENFKVFLGKGITSTIDSKRVLVGNQKLLDSENIIVSIELLGLFDKYEDEGKTVMAVVIDSKIIGLITIADEIKQNSMNSVLELKDMGIKDIVMLSGDNKRAAEAIAHKAKIEEVYAEQLPEDKVFVIQRLIKEGKKVCMVGDGINDAPALAVSGVGIAMGALGSDIAIDSADIALMSDDIANIPKLIMLARKVLKTININIVISMGINFIAIILAYFGILNPISGALVHNLGSLVVIANSATLITYAVEKKNGKKRITESV